MYTYRHIDIKAFKDPLAVGWW